MVQTVLIGIAAGFAAALLYASVASGSVISIVLFCLAPLPVMIAALGWSHIAGLVAAVLAAGLVAAFGGFHFINFLVEVGLPAWWLGYLTLLARPASTPAPDTLEWYPVGGLVVWCAILGTLTIAVIIFKLGLGADSFHTGIRQLLEQILRAVTGAPKDAPLQFPGFPDTNLLLDVLVAIIPPMAGTLTTITNVSNLWLAGRIVKVSGRLKRPWPDISAMKFPAYAPALLAAALGLAFAPVFASLVGGRVIALAPSDAYSPSLITIIAGVLTASLLMAYALLGFAVVHASTRTIGARGVVLAGLYAAVAFFQWPVLLMALLGLVDTVLDIRGRIARKRGPPEART